MSIAPFPHAYAVSFVEGALHASPRTPIRAGAPPQFGGDAYVWSPEELLVGAVLLCWKTTFDAYAARHSLVVKNVRGDGVGTLVKGPEGPVFSGIALDVEVVVDAADADRARELAHRAERDCILSRAIRAPVELRCTISTRPPDAIPADVG